MGLPWLRFIDGMLGLTDVVRRVKGPAPVPDREQFAIGGRALGAIEARLAGVVVAALREAFNRDSQRLELERQQIEAERQRAERALRLELARQAAEREIGRLKMLGGVAVVSWLASLVLALGPMRAAMIPRIILGFGWLFLLGGLTSAFTAQGQIGRAIGVSGNGDDVVASIRGGAAAAAQWLVVAGLAAIALAVLLV